MESGNFIFNGGDLLKLAEQQLVDCADNGNEGCDGGFTDKAFEWSEKNPIMLEADYPYKAVTGTCHQDKSKGKVELDHYGVVDAQSVLALKTALNDQPVAVRVAASSTYFHLYEGGILDTDKCGTDLNHAVVAVGYGSESGKDYLIVRNSWTADWGEQGYIRMALNKDGVGVCGVLMGPSTYPRW